MSGLPIRNISKQSDRDVTLFFDKYYTKPISLTDNELTTVLGFFESRVKNLRERIENFYLQLQ